MAIQISMAPAFLLVAISNLINGTTATRQRIIDRYRQLTAEKSDVLIRSDEVEYEKSVLRHRVSLLTRSIILLTSAIMLIALVVLYVGFAAYLRWKYGPAPKRKPVEGSKRHSKTSRRKR